MSLKDRSRSVDLYYTSSCNVYYSLVGVQCVADVVI